MTEPKGYEELARGAWGRVLGIRDRTSCPSGDWLRSLNPREQAAMAARLERLAEKGTLQTPDYFRRLTAAGQSPIVFEVKHVPTNLRLYVLKGNRVYYATHGGTKPKKNRVSHEVARALEIYNGRHDR